MTAAEVRPASTSAKGGYMKAVVVGAGPSGLAALKELSEVGFEAVGFEADCDLGGVFRFDPEGRGVWRDCRLTSSATTTAFSDFPPEDDSPHQMLHDEYWRYLDAYARTFGLRDRITFEARVSSLEPRPGGGWIVTTSHADGASRTTEADVIAWCAGLHQAPAFPAFVQEFAGEVHHSAGFKDATPYANRRVLVVGAGESGADIIKMVADVADRCALSLRRGVAVLPRMRNGLPTDYFTTRLFYSLPRWMARAARPGRTVMVRRLATALITLPITLVMALVVMSVETFGKIKQGKRGLPLPVVRKIVELMKMSGGSVGDQFLTKSEAFVHAIVEGKCTLRGPVSAVSGRQVTFSDGQSEAFDTILCCTGFTPRIDAFPAIDTARLYRRVFSPDLGASVGFIGFARPAIGAIPPLAEMQARLFAQVASGRLSLPNQADMNRAVDAQIEQQGKQFDLNRERMPYLVDYTAYMDEMAAVIGCKPTAKDIRGDLRLLYKFYCAHFMPAQYRLVGPGARPRAAQAQIKKQVVAYSPLYLPFFLFYLYFSKILNKLGLRAYKPHLAI